MLLPYNRCITLQPIRKLCRGDAYIPRTQPVASLRFDFSDRYLILYPQRRHMIDRHVFDD